MEEFNINLEILRLLSEGLDLNEVSAYLTKKGIRPCSLSSVDKKLKAMREEFNCSTIHQLMYKVGYSKLLNK